MIEQISTSINTAKENPIKDESIKAKERIQEALTTGQVKGTIQHPEIYIKNTPEVDQSLSLFHISGFPEGDFLVISTWHDIGILYNLGLVNFDNDLLKDDAIQGRPGKIQLVFPDDPKFDSEYGFPSPLSPAVFPSINAHPKSSEALDSSRPREYTRLPNLALFHDEYRWKDGVLYKRIKNNGKISESEVTKQEQQNLLERAKNGDRVARNEIPKIHLGLVLSILTDIQEKFGGEGDDMIQAGFIGLMKAVEQYDPTLGGAFSTYAKIKIESSIRKHLKDTKKMIRIPENRNKEIVAYHKTVKKLEHELGRSPMHEEISRQLNMTSIDLDRFEREVGINRSFVGLIHEDQLTEDKGGHIAFDDPTLYQNSENTNPPLDETTQQDFFDSLDDTLDQLTRRERLVLRCRFGINVHSPITKSKFNTRDNYMTLEQVANIFGVTKEVIRQVEAKALRKLRHPSRAEKFRVFFDNLL